MRDFDHEIEDHERILQALAPLLDELERFLRARQRGITALQCRFHHYRAAPTRCTLRLAAPEANAERFTQPAARTSRHARSARARAALRVAQRRAHPSHRGQPGRCGRPVNAGMRARERCRRSSNTCARGSATPRCTASRAYRNTARKTPGAWPNPKMAEKMGTSLFNDESDTGPRALSPLNKDVPIFPFRRPLWLLAAPHRSKRNAGGRGMAGRSNCSRVPNASRAAGGMALMSGVTTTSRSDRTARACGSTVNATGAKQWFLQGSSDEMPRLRYAPFPQYAELHCLSNFSFLRGASHAEELVAQARELGYTALAITDECSLAGRGARPRRRKEGRRHQTTHRRGVQARLRAAPGDHRAQPRGLRPTVAAHHARSPQAQKGSYRLDRADVEEFCRSMARTPRRSARTVGRWHAGLVAAAAVHGCGRSRVHGSRATSRGAPGSRWSWCATAATASAWRARARWVRSTACRYAPPATCTCTCANAGGCRMRSRRCVTG